MKQHRMTKRDGRIVDYLNRTFNRTDAAQVLVDIATGYDITPHELCDIIAKHPACYSWCIAPFKR